MAIVKRFTYNRKCDTPDCPHVATYLEKHGPGRAPRVQLCWNCAKKRQALQSLAKLLDLKPISANGSLGRALKKTP